MSETQYYDAAVTRTKQGYEKQEALSVRCEATYILGVCMKITMNRTKKKEVLGSVR